MNKNWLKPAKYALFVGLFMTFMGCKNNNPTEQKTTTATPTPTREALPQNPAERFGALFDTVQMSGIFPDSKTFVDYSTKMSDEQILQNFETQRRQPNFDLRAFVNAHFDAPPQYGTDYKTDLTKSADQHITELWDILTRKPDGKNPKSTLLPLPNSYIVPGGRFREIYYWDSYFTMLGLAEDKKTDMMDNMVQNFAHLIRTYGFIPNGNRTYYLTRSQPPFFASMVNILAESKGDSTVLTRFLPEMQAEYDFWMNSPRRFKPTEGGHDDYQFLNRYCDNGNTPRPEGYKEDVETAKKFANGKPLTPDQTQRIYKNLRSGAESGWDYSSRWFADGKNISTIEILDIAPIDLNTLLYHLELTLARAYRMTNNAAKATALATAAQNRRAAINKYCFDPVQNTFFDYNVVRHQRTQRISAAALFPLFFDLATPEQAKGVMEMTKKHLLRAGGIVATPYKTGQQWDAPNGWAPLQWVAIQGLRNYGFNDMSNDIKKRWTGLNVKVYQKTGKMLEKYNVEDLSLTSGGGEYPVQDGFGWTNGVLRKALSEEQNLKN